MNKKTARKQAGCKTGKPLKLTVTIPGPIVPLFQAMAMLVIADQPRFEFNRRTKKFKKIRRWTLRDVASEALVKWTTCEDTMNHLDTVVNRVLNQGAD